jgi:type I restriction enzyme S subunit
VNTVAWRKVQIKDIGRVVTGRTPPTAVASYFGNDLPFITPSDMDGRRTITETERYVSAEGAKFLASAVVPPKSVAVSCIGWQMGKVILTGITCVTNQQINTIIPDYNVVPEFLYYSLSTRRDELKTLASVGTRTPILIKSSFEKVTLDLPPLPTQRKIATILSVYDDLIENNTRRIKILEEMAQALYREWFVRFRFPGHEGVRLVETELGLVPEGWEVVSLRDVTSYINRGVSPKYNDRATGLVINQKCIRDGRLNMEAARRHNTKVPSEKVVRFGDVLINSTGIGTLGRVAQVYEELSDTTVDSHVSIVRASERASWDYFGFALLALQPHFDSLGVGSTGQTELGRERIAGTTFLLPNKALQDKFGEVVSPMRRNVVTTFARNTILRRTRDLLLPKLISGEIDVATDALEAAL